MPASWRAQARCVSLLDHTSSEISKPSPVNASIGASARVRTLARPRPRSDQQSVARGALGSGRQHQCYQLSGHEFTDEKRDLGAVRLERKMPGVEKMDLGVRQVPLERLGACRKEDRIVLS